MKLDLEKIKASLDCDDAFVAQLFDSYITESTECVEGIQKAFDTKEWNKVGGAAHKMLGATRIFDVAELINLLDEIKTDAEKETHLDTIGEKIDKLKVLHKESIESMNELKTRMEQLQH